MCNQQEAGLFVRHFSQFVNEAGVYVEFTPKGLGPLLIEILPYWICIAMENDSKTPLYYRHSYLSRTICGNILENMDLLFLKNGQVNILKLHYNCGAITISLNGQEFSFSSNYKPSLSEVKIHWPAETQLQQIEIVEGKPACAAVLSSTKSDSYEHHITVDFIDDLLPVAFTKDTMKAMFRNISESGFSRVNWIYYGDISSGIWSPNGDHLSVSEDHIQRTYSSIGTDDLKRAVEIGHAEGLEVYAVLKPFDMSIMGINFPAASEDGQKYGKCDVLGGRAYLAFDFPSEHPELCMKRRPWDRCTNNPISKIVVTSRAEFKYGHAKIRIWVSKDNYKFEPCRQRPQVTECGTEIVIDGLSVTEKYLAIEIVDSRNKYSIFNTVSELVRMFDANGAQIPFTYGFKPREYAKKGNVSHLDAKFGETDFTKDGFWFDYFCSDMPSSVFCGAKAYNELYAVDNNYGVIGIARDMNEFVPGVMCPSEKQARQYWLSLIERALDNGADGIDIRVTNHANVLEWPVYGFNHEVVKAYHEQTGLDPFINKFDWEVWRRLRGQFYSKFLQEVRDLTRLRNKKLQLHIEDVMEGTPDMSTMMEIHWDWQYWLDFIKPDSVTLKALNAGGIETSITRAVIAKCNAQNIPVYFCPFVHSIMEQEDVQNYLAKVRNSGVNGLVIYEHATVFPAKTDGTLSNQYPKLMDYLRAELNG